MKRFLVIGVVFVYMVMLGLNQVRCRRGDDDTENSRPENHRRRWNREESSGSRPRPWAHRPGGVSTGNSERGPEFGQFRHKRRQCNEDEVRFMHSCIPRDQWEYYMLFATIFFLGLFACLFICVLFIAVKLYNRYMRWRNRKLYGCPVRKSHLPSCACQCFRENVQVDPQFSINSVENINSFETPCSTNNSNREGAAQPHGIYPSFDNISTSRNDFSRKNDPPTSKYHLLK
jgi:hypothetical protein